MPFYRSTRLKTSSSASCTAAADSLNRFRALLQQKKNSSRYNSAEKTNLDSEDDNGDDEEYDTDDNEDIGNKSSASNECNLLAPNKRDKQGTYLINHITDHY